MYINLSHFDKFITGLFLPMIMVRGAENIFLDTLVGSFELCISAGNGSLGKRGWHLINNSRDKLKEDNSLTNRLQQIGGYVIGGSFGTALYFTLVTAYLSLAEGHFRNKNTNQHQPVSSRTASTETSY